MRGAKAALPSDASDKVKKSLSRNSIPIQSLLNPELSASKQRSKPYPSRRKEATSPAEEKIAELPLPKELRDIVQVEAKEAYVYVAHHDLESYVGAYRDKYIDESQKAASDKAASQKGTSGRDTCEKNASPEEACGQHTSQHFASQQHASQNVPFQKGPFHIEHVARQNAAATETCKRPVEVNWEFIKEICQKPRASLKDVAAEANKPTVVVDWQCVETNSVDILPYIFVYIRFKEVRWFLKLGSGKLGGRIPFVIKEMVGPHAPSWATWITENKNVRTVQLWLKESTVDIILKSACLDEHDWECVPRYGIDACNEKISLKIDLGFARIWEKATWMVNVVVQSVES